MKLYSLITIFTFLATSNDLPERTKVCYRDGCRGTLTNPIPFGQQWHHGGRASDFGCCAFAAGACDWCSPLDSFVVVPSTGSCPRGRELNEAQCEGLSNSGAFSYFSDAGTYSLSETCGCYIDQDGARYFNRRTGECNQPEAGEQMICVKEAPNDSFVVLPSTGSCPRGRELDEAQCEGLSNIGEFSYFREAGAYSLPETCGCYIDQDGARYFNRMTGECNRPESGEHMICKEAPTDAFVVLPSTGSCPRGRELDEAECQGLGNSGAFSYWSAAGTYSLPETCGCYIDQDGGRYFNRMTGECNQPEAGEQMICKPVPTGKPVPFGTCSTNIFGIDFCNNWCNTEGKWGCGISTLSEIDGLNPTSHDYTCDCTGCNGCGGANPCTDVVCPAVVCDDGSEPPIAEGQCCGDLTLCPDSHVLGETGQSCTEVCTGLGRTCSRDLSGVTRDTFQGLLNTSGLGICRDDAGCDEQGSWYAHDQPAFVATGLGDANEQCCLGHRNIPRTGVDCDASFPTVKRVCNCEGASPNQGGAAPVIPVGGNYPNFPVKTWGQYEVEYEGQTCSVKSYAGDYFDNILFRVSNLGLAQCSDSTTVFAGELHILPHWFRDTEFNLFVECPNGVCTATIPIGIGLDACDAILFAATLGTGNAAAATGNAVKSTSTGIGATARKLYQTIKDTAQTLKTTVKNLASTNAPRLTRALKEAQKAQQRFSEVKQKVTDEPSGACETYGGYASQLLKANERTASLGDIVDDLLAVIGDLFGSVSMTIDIDFDLVLNHRLFGGNSNAPFPVASQASKLTLGWKFGKAFCAIPINTALCIAIGVLTDITHDLMICTHVEFVFDFPTATQVFGGKSEWSDVSIEFKCLESASATEIALETWNKLETLIKSVGINTDKLGLSGITNGLEFFDETVSGYRERLCPDADFTNVVGNALFLDNVFPIERAICTQGNHGTYCLRNYECRSGVCSFARCANKGDIGEICNTHSDCISNYCSNAFQCSDKSDGSQCVLNRDCNSYRCELGRGGKCVAREGEGHSCNEDSDCLSDNCSFFFCREPGTFFGRRLMEHDIMSARRV